MEPMTMLMLSMQAGGMIFSLWDSKNNYDMIKLGRQLEQNQFEFNMQAIATQGAIASADEIKDIRKNIGSQIAINAARGSSKGSSAWQINQAYNTFADDERKRRLNLLSQESDLRANHVLSGLHTLQSESQLGRSLSSSILNSLQTTSLLSNRGGPASNKSLTNAASTSAGRSASSASNMFNWGIS